MQLEEINNAIATSSQFVDTINQLISTQSNMEYGMHQLDVQLEAYTRTLQAGLNKHNINLNECRSTLDNYNSQISKLIDHALAMDDNNPKKWELFDRASSYQKQINDIIFKILDK